MADALKSNHNAAERKMPYPYEAISQVQVGFLPVMKKHGYIGSLKSLTITEHQRIHHGCQPLDWWYF